MARDFAGTWRVVSLDDRAGEEISVARMAPPQDPQQFRITPESPSGAPPFADDILQFDAAACVLRNDTVCLSLFHDSDVQGFGMEYRDNDFKVWAIDRLSGGGDPLTAAGTAPEVSGRQWMVRAKSGDSEQPREGDRVEITGPDAENRFTICATPLGSQDCVPYDSALLENARNRTLDSSAPRSIALWSRGDGLADLLFARLNLSAGLLREIRDKIKDKIRSTPFEQIARRYRLLPFELQILSQQILRPGSASLEEGTTVVWGAEEG